MAYYKKILLISFIVVCFLFLFNNKIFAFQINGEELPTPSITTCTGNFPSNMSNFTNYIFCYNGLPYQGGPCLIVFPDNFDGRVYIDGTPSSCYIRTSPSINYAHFWFNRNTQKYEFMALGQYSNYHLEYENDNLTFTSIDIYTNNTFSSIYKGAVSQTNNFIEFLSSMDNDFLRLAKGTSKNFPFLVGAYDVTTLNTDIYFTIYKNVGNNLYDIYYLKLFDKDETWLSNNVDIFRNDNDLFCYIPRSRIMSTGLSFDDMFEYYVVLSDSPTPLGYTYLSFDITRSGFYNGSLQLSYDGIFDIFSTAFSDGVITDFDKEQDLQEKQLDAINNQTNAINNQTNAINNQTSFLQDGTIDSSIFQLPTDTTNDTTMDILNNIFTMFYNAFSSGEPIDIVIPIPYTNKNIVINPNFLYNIMQQEQFKSLYDLIQSFYWFVIASFIVLDVFDKINKIKSGDIENIQKNNIKADML